MRRSRCIWSQRATSFTTRAILRDFREIGDALWSRFKGGKEGTLWYYRALVEAFRKAGSTPLVEQFDRVVSKLERITIGA